MIYLYKGDCAPTLYETILYFDNTSYQLSNLFSDRFMSIAGALNVKPLSGSQIDIGSELTFPFFFYHARANVTYSSFNQQ